MPGSRPVERSAGFFVSAFRDEKTGPTAGTCVALRADLKRADNVCSGAAGTTTRRYIDAPTRDIPTNVVELALAIP